MSHRRHLVRFTTLSVACLVLLTSSVNIAQTGAETKDPVTGKWGSDGFTNLDLKFDGKSGVSGTTIWRSSNRFEHRAVIRTGSFDVRTSVLRLEGEGRTPDGDAVMYVVEGTIEDDTLTGTFTFGANSGRFTFKRHE